MHLDHITIRTRDLRGTRAFFLKLFDELEERARPQGYRSHSRALALCR